jgi:hypothetical protein
MKHTNNTMRLMVVGILLVSIVGAALAQAQSSQHIPLIQPIQQGLMSRLIEIKYSTELYLSHQIKKETGKTPQEIDSALAQYNTIRWKVDGLVYQLSSAMIARNSPAILIELDKWHYEKENKKEEKVADLPKRIQQYVNDLRAIETIYAAVVLPKIIQVPTNTRTLNLTTNVFYLLKDSYSIVKGLSDIKTRKVMALVELLDHARLLAPGEVVKMGK